MSPKNKEASSLDRINMTKIQLDLKQEVESKRVKREDRGRRRRQSDQERIYKKGFRFVSKTIKW